MCIREMQWEKGIRMHVRGCAKPRWFAYTYVDVPTTESLLYPPMSLQGKGGVVNWPEWSRSLAYLYKISGGRAVIILVEGPFWMK